MLSLPVLVLDLTDIRTALHDLCRPSWRGERLPSAEIPTPDFAVMSEAARDATLPSKPCLITPWSWRWWVRSVNIAFLAETEGCYHYHQANRITAKGLPPRRFRRCYVFLTLAVQWLCSGFRTTAQLIPGCKLCPGIPGSGAGCSLSPRGRI